MAAEQMVAVSALARERHFIARVRKPQRVACRAIDRRGVKRPIHDVSADSSPCISLSLVAAGRSQSLGQRCERPLRQDQP